MIPHPESVRVLFEVRAQPVSSFKSFLPAALVACFAEAVIVRQAPLRNRDRVVLQTDGTAIVEHRDAAGVVLSAIIGLFSKPHVVLAEASDIGPRIDFWY